MLYLCSGTFGDGKGKTVHQWHVGEPIPNIKGPVVTFQADGDELSVLMAAIVATSRKEPFNV